MKSICILLVLFGFSDKLFSEDNIEKIKYENNNVLNCDSLIQICQGNSIYSSLDDSISSIYLKPKGKGRFIRYILIADSMLIDEPTGDILGSLVVYKKTKSQEKVEFIEIISNYFPTLTIYDKIRVGVSSEILKENLGEPDKIVNDTYIYKNNKTHVIALFRIINDSVFSFRVGKYNEKILDSIEENLDLLLNSYP